MVSVHFSVPKTELTPFISPGQYTLPTVVLEGLGPPRRLAFTGAYDMGGAHVGWLRWGVILFLLCPLGFILSRQVTVPQKASVVVLRQPRWEATAQGTGGVLALQFSDAGDYLLTSSAGDEWKGVELWSIPLRRRDRAMRVPGTVYSVRFSRLGGRSSLMAGAGDRIFQWTGNGTDASVHQFAVRRARLTALVPLNEKSIAVLFDGPEPFIGIVDSSWELVQQLGEHAKGVTAIAPFGEDALVSAGRDGRIVLWRKMDGLMKIQHCIEQRPTYGLVAAHHAGGSIAAFDFMNSAIHLFRVDGGITLSATVSTEGRDVRGLTFTSDGKFLLGAAQTLNCCAGEVMVHEVGKTGIRRWFYAHRLPTTCIAAGENPDLFATGGGDSMIRLWSLPDVLGREEQQGDVQK